MGRRLRVIAAGAGVGFVAGVLAPVTLVAAAALFKRMSWSADRLSWSALVDPDAAPYIAGLAVLGAVNGAVGAWDGWRSGLRRAWPVAVVPGLLFLFPAVLGAWNPADSKAWGVTLLLVGIVAPFAWVAGRLGQELGVRGRTGTPNQPAQQIGAGGVAEREPR